MNKLCWPDRPTLFILFSKIAACLPKHTIFNVIEMSIFQCSSAWLESCIYWPNRHCKYSALSRKKLNNNYDDRPTSTNSTNTKHISLEGSSLMIQEHANAENPHTTKQIHGGKKCPAPLKRLLHFLGDQTLTSNWLQNVTCSKEYWRI